MRHELTVREHETWPKFWEANKEISTPFFNCLQKLDLYVAEWRPNRLSLELLNNLFLETIYEKPENTYTIGDARGVQK